MKRHLFGGFIVILISMSLSASADIGRMGPRDTYADTAIVVDGKPNCSIVIPDEPGYAQLARKVADAIRKKTGAIVPVVSSAKVADRPFHLAEKHRGRHLIVLGNNSNNVAHLALYANLLAMADKSWPGPNGYELRTACNPFGTNRNCIVLGGSDISGTALAVEAMLDRLAGFPNSPNLTIPRWCTVVVQGKDQSGSEVQPFPEPAGTREGQSSFNSAWRTYQLTGHPAALAHLGRYMAFLAEKGASWEHYWGPVIIDPIEFCSNNGIAGPGQLEKIDNWLLQSVEKGRDYSLFLGAREGGFGNRHQTYGTYGFYRSWKYLLAGAPDLRAREYLKPLVKGTRDYLDSLLTGYRDDCPPPIPPDSWSPQPAGKRNFQP